MFLEKFHYGKSLGTRKSAYYFDILHYTNQLERYGLNYLYIIALIYICIQNLVIVCE